MAAGGSGDRQSAPVAKPDLIDLQRGDPVGRPESQPGLTRLRAVPSTRPDDHFRNGAATPPGAFPNSPLVTARAPSPLLHGRVTPDHHPGRVAPDHITCEVIDA